MKPQPGKSVFFYFFVSIVLVFLFGIKLNGQVSLYEEDWVLPTYQVLPPDKNPMFFKGESYQGASKYIYPYGLNDMISNDREYHPWKTLILENEYIKLCITPEIGGKLYYATDKTNGYNFIYKNNVVKPSNIGMTGAWVSGGIEWCVLHHHRASTFLPVDYELQEHNDGSKTIWIGETEPRHRMRWTIGITAYPGKSYFSANVKVHNPTPFTHTFLYWANVATHTNEDYQVVFPPSVTHATYHAKNSFTNWPFSTEVYNGEDFTHGVDLSYWKNSVNQNSYFAHNLKEDFMGGYDHGRQTGTVHVGNHHIVKGAKLWEWGSGARGQATEALLTEDDGPYVEIMVGAFSDNQPDYSWIRPYEVKSFTQYWYPVKDIGGFKYANLNGAVNLEKREGDKVFLGYYATRKIDRARITLSHNGTTVYENIREISPETAFTATIPINTPFELTGLSTEMTDLATNEVLVAYQPVERPEAGPLPEAVRRPPMPEEVQTVEELYLIGSRILQFYNPTLRAMDYFEEALRRDPGDIRTNVAVGNEHLKKGEYTLARACFSKAIGRLTRDYTRPSDCEALFLQGLTLKAMGLLEEATDTLYRATWDHAWHAAAYLELAKISSEKGDYVKALYQVNESLSTNSRNNRAINLKASLQRKLGDLVGAARTLSEINLSDPLDFRAGNEAYLIARDAGNVMSEQRLLSSLKKKMRGFEQNYLELAFTYLDDGLAEEAEEVLLMFEGQNQMISYSLGYLQDLKGNREAASGYFREASALSLDYGFPFRPEEMKVLEKAIAYHPEDARPHYYIGNLLYDKQPARAIACWETAVKLDPSLSIAWRNLGWGYFYFANDLQKAIDAYEQALAINKEDPVYYAELDPLYEMNNTPIEIRARLFESSHEVVKQRDDAFFREMLVLNLSGRPDLTVEYLKNSVFHFREGSSRIREITVDAHLLMGRKFLEEGKNSEALEHFLLTVEDPDDINPRRRSGEARNLQINYYIGLAYEALGERDKAFAHFSASAGQIVSERNGFLYYQGLSLLKLGEGEKARQVFNAMIEEASNRIQHGSEIDFFAKFGDREAANVQLSNAYLMKGLGHKGLGQETMAGENLSMAVNLSSSNLWAKTELQK